MSNPELYRFGPFCVMPLRAGSPKLNSSAPATYKMVGIHVRGQSVIVDHTPNERATHQGIGMLAADWTNIVEPHDGGTKLTMKLEYTIPVPVLGKLAEHLTIRRNARELEASLLNLKETLEA